MASFVHGLAELARLVGQSQDMDDILAQTLGELRSRFGLEHVFILLHDPVTERLATVASHGYEQSGVGAEVAVGVGTIGVVARSRRPMRSGNLRMELGYARAVRKQSARAGETLGNEIPLPGLRAPASQLVVPLVARNELVGVLCTESDKIAAFDGELESALVVVGTLLGAALEHARIASTDESDEPLPPPASPVTLGPSIAVRHYADDDSVFINDEYIIKGLAGRILFKLLTAHRDEGRTQFANRQLRLASELKLSPYRDNVESRLLLLRRRLDEKACGVSLAKTGRGRFELVLAAKLALESVPAR